MSVMLVTSSVTTAHPVDVQWTAVDMVHVVQAWNASVQTDGKEMIALRKIVVVSLVVVVVVVVIAVLWWWWFWEEREGQECSFFFGRCFVFG